MVSVVLAWIVPVATAALLQWGEMCYGHDSSPSHLSSAICHCACIPVSYVAPVSPTQVLDWEMSTIGHPMADVANMVGYLFPAPALASMFTGGSPDTPLPAVTDTPHYKPVLATEDDVIRLYCSVTGFPLEHAQLPFYKAFYYFKSSVILHGIAARAAQGTASNAKAEALVAFIPLLVDLALGAMGLAPTRSPAPQLHKSDSKL